MKTVTIRECAFEACKMLDYRGEDLLFAAITEAMTGEAPNFDDDEKWSFMASRCKAVYAAIAPDIIASAQEETDEPAAIAALLSVLAQLQDED